MGRQFGDRWLMISYPHRIETNLSMKPRVAYVVKRYPRFSETFIVNEILAHESAGVQIDLFSLRPPVDTHFQDLISRVRAPLTYLSDGQGQSSRPLAIATQRCQSAESAS